MSAFKISVWFEFIRDCFNNPLKYWDPTGHAATLQRGSKGDGVAAIQEMLNVLGYNCGATDGIFGKNTQAAIIKYQKDHGLQVDGIVGNQTLTALKTNVNVQAAPDFVQEKVMKDVAKTQVGAIKDDTILMSTTTFNNTLNAISNIRQSTGGTVNTAVVNNHVVVTGVTPSSTASEQEITPTAPPVVTQKPSQAPNTSADQGVSGSTSQGTGNSATSQGTLGNNGFSVIIPDNYQNREVEYNVTGDDGYSLVQITEQQNGLDQTASIINANWVTPSASIDDNGLSVNAGASVAARAL